MRKASAADRAYNARLVAMELVVEAERPKRARFACPKCRILRSRKHNELCVSCTVPVMQAFGWL